LLVSLRIFVFSFHKVFNLLILFVITDRMNFLFLFCFIQLFLSIGGVLVPIPSWILQSKEVQLLIKKKMT
jgi:hypothetical protein